MIKRITATLLLLTILAAGIGYSIYQDPERRERDLFDGLIAALAQQSAPLEHAFQQSQLLPPREFDLRLDYTDSQNLAAAIAARVVINDNRLTVTFADGDTQLANQTAIFEPFIKSERVMWKCLSGSILMRYRPRPCRLGEGISLHQF